MSATACSCRVVRERLRLPLDNEHLAHTIRQVFVKIAVRVEELKRSIKLAFPRLLPHADALALVTGRLTAQGS